jgi:hypothetical protein
VALACSGVSGALGRIRTADPQIRSLWSRLSASFRMFDNAYKIDISLIGSCLLLPLV